MSGAILLVEDNPADVMLTQTVLQREHILNALHVVEDIPQALEYLFSGTHPLPVLVLLDLTLRGGDGLEVLWAIRADAATAGIPVLVLTISDTQEDVIRSYRLGASSFLRKPLDMAKLAQAMRGLGMGWMINGMEKG